MTMLETDTTRFTEPVLLEETWNEECKCESLHEGYTDPGCSHVGQPLLQRCGFVEAMGNMLLLPGSNKRMPNGSPDLTRRGSFRDKLGAALYGVLRP